MPIYENFQSNGASRQSVKLSIESLKWDLICGVGGTGEDPKWDFFFLWHSERRSNMSYVPKKTVS